MSEVIGSISVVASINTKDYDSGKKKIEQGNKELESSSSNTADALKTAFKASFAAASVAATAFFVTAIKGFSEYEQVAGGAQKIFDEIDFKDISKDAQNAFKTMNLSATDYFKLINQVGANFASTMGDEKGYETAKVGLQAISDFATGTGANVDILGDKFQAIARSTATYQSIADQFAGVLPATSKSFLKTAQNAGLLDESYTKLTEVPIDEYQVALSGLLKKGVRDLGLQGNAAAETEKTISGSFAGMTASWSNFTSALASGDVEVAKTALQNLGTTGAAFLNNVWKAAQNIVAVIGQMASDFLKANPMIAATIEVLKQLVVVISILLIPAMLRYIALQTKAGVNALIAGARMAAGWLLALGPIGLLMALIGVFVALVVMNFKTISSVVSSVFKNIVQFATRAWDSIKSVFSKVGSWFGSVFQNAWNNIKGAFSGMVGWFRGIWTKVTGIFKAAGDAIGNAVGGAFKAAINGAITMVQNALNAPINAINGAIGQINKLPGVDIGKIPTLNLPKLAKGGIVSSATIAMIGEGSEPEAVIPLSKLDKMLDNEGGGKTIENNIGTININSEVDGDKWLRRLNNDTEISSAGLTPQQRYM